MLIWVLAVALPVQGVAAATMLACGPHHRHSGASASPTSHAPRSVSHHSHLHVPNAAAPARAAAADMKGDTATLAEAPAHKCSACASCCLSAGVATEAIVFLAVDSPDLFARLVTRTPAAYVTEGPERPPRRVLA